ncbi:unnamed protein product [Calicophoron daubneyi]|uniref:Cytochrome b5 heme-binding domain-containing protein n=1 Tax=Calicophoron daubneyi TaxID=300641 RepID=A0AAV2T7A0_CALDB
MSFLAHLSQGLNFLLSCLTCPLNIFLFIVCILLVYFIFRPSFHKRCAKLRYLPKLSKRDFTLEELRQFNGYGPEERILIAVNGKVFDVSNSGQDLYGKSAPYAAFAGRDASRALACFKADVSCVNNGYDDLSDLSPAQMNTLREWELQFLDKYDYVGRLLKPGEPHRVYESSADLLTNAPSEKKLA